MALPASVARKAEEASRLILAASGAPNPATPPPAATGDAAGLQQKLSDTQEELRKAQEALKALEGKYNAEVPRTAAELRQAKADLKAASDRLKEHEERLKKQIESGEVRSLSDDERRLLGDDTIKATAKIATEAAQRVFEQSIAPLSQRFDEFARLSEAAYFAALDDECPSWERVNEDPKFIVWLNEQDPATKRTRYDLLKRAEAARQGYRVVSIFNAYLEGREIGAAKSPPPPNPLEPRAEPGPSGASQVDVSRTADGKKVWFQSEILKFYNEKRRGLWRGREQEAISTEHDIFAAQKEGRVRPG